MSIRAILHNTVAVIALVMIALSLLFFADAVLNGGAVARYVLCAVGFFGGETILKAVGAYEY